MAVALQPLSGTSLKDRREIFPVGRNSNSAPVCSLCLEGEMAIQLLQIHGLWPVVSMDNKALRRNILENLWQGNFGKRYVDTLFWMSKGIKIFVSHVKLTKGWPQQRRILIIKWLGWPDSLWIPPDSLFPQPPVIGQWAYERRGQAGRDDGGYAWAQQHGLPLSKAYLAMATAECPICQQQILSLSPQYGPLFLLD